MADAILRRLKASNALREQVTALVRRHMTPLEPDKKLLRRRLGKYGLQGTLDLLELQRADFCNKGTPAKSDRFDRVAELIRQIREEDACLTLRDLAINGQDLIALGMVPGPQFSKHLNALLAMVQDDLIPNTREALLEAARAYL
jgi:tRNA nucleotidyltransferase (CCA-adding enzyme)